MSYEITTPALLDRRPLSNGEERAIRAAIDQAWSGPLREMLALLVQARGLWVSPHDHCGDLAEALEWLAQGDYRPGLNGKGR